MADVQSQIQVTDTRTTMPQPTVTLQTVPQEQGLHKATSRSRPSSGVGPATDAGNLPISQTSFHTPRGLSVDETTSGPSRRSLSHRPDGHGLLDPLSQEIYQRTNGQPAVLPKISSRPSDSLSRPPTGTNDEPAQADSSTVTPKQKLKGVAFLARFIGNKRKDSVDDSKTERDSEASDTRPEGAEAEIFLESIDNLGYNPEHIPPPPYIKVRSRNKSEREFNRVFLAQALGPEATSSPNDSASAPTTSSSRTRTLSNVEGDAVWALEFSKDGRYLASTGQDKNVRIWSVLGTREDRRAHEKQEEEANASRENPSTRLSAPVFRNKPLRLYTGHTAPVLDLSWSKNNFLLSCSMDKTVRLWHVSQNECLCVFKHNDVVTSIQFHPKDDRFFLAGSLDSRLRLWSIPDKTVAFHVAVSDIITAVAFTPDGHTAIAGCVSGLCSFFDTEQLKLQTQIHVKSAHGKNAKGSKITGLETTYLPSGSNNVKLLVTSNDSRVRLYNIRDKSLEMKFKGNENTSSQIRARFSDDGRYVICGSEDKKVFIWSTTQPESERRNKWPVEMFEAHNNMATAAVLAPVRTRMLLSASEDPLYDLCNPPPITLISKSEIESLHSKKAQDDDDDNNSIQPTPATAEGGGSFRRPDQSPAYTARTAHPNGNLLITADATGTIKVFRQDCAWDKRNIDPWETSAHRTKRASSRIIRRASLATQSSAHRSRQDSIKSQAPSERILSWRQSITSTTSHDTKSTASILALSRGKSTSSKRNESPRNKSLAQYSRQSSVAPSHITVSTPPSERDAASDVGRTSTSMMRKDSADTTHSASQASLLQKPNYQRGTSGISNTSSQYWRQTAWHEEIIDQLQHAQASTTASGTNTPSIQLGRPSRGNSSNTLNEMGRLEKKMSRISQLSSARGDDDERTKENGNDPDTAMKCLRCSGQDFRARITARGGSPRFACTHCGLTVGTTL